MRPELILSQRPELRLQLSPQLIQRIEILQLGATDLQELVENELLSNELLVAQPSTNKDKDVGRESQDEVKRDEVAAENGPTDSESRINLDSWSEGLRTSAPRRVRSDDTDPKQEALNNTPSRPATLVDHLDFQISLENASDGTRELARYFVRCLDHNGWLLEPIEELMIPFLDQYSMDDAENAVALLQRLDPAGVGARSPAECLLLQLSDDHPEAPLLRKLIAGSLDDLGRNRLPKVARDLGVSIDKVKELTEILRTDFDPFPGRRYEHIPNRRVRPDVVVEKLDGEYRVRLEDDYLPRLALDEVRLQAIRDRQLNSDLKKQLRRDVESARWLIESIEQRKRTLERVALEIVARQQDFLEHGINHLKPLKMQEIADELGIHVSTVSRALKGKYIQTPQGVHEMKFFFTGASRGTDGVVESRTGVKERVREIYRSRRQDESTVRRRDCGQAQGHWLDHRPPYGDQVSKVDGDSILTATPGILSGLAQQCERREVSAGSPLFHGCPIRWRQLSWLATPAARGCDRSRSARKRTWPLTASGGAGARRRTH